MWGQFTADDLISSLSEDNDRTIPPPPPPASRLSKLMKINKNENSIMFFKFLFLTTSDLLFRKASFSFSIARQQGSIALATIRFFLNVRNIHEHMIHWFLTLTAFSTVVVCAPERTRNIDALEMNTTVVRRFCAFVNVCKKGMNKFWRTPRARKRTSRRKKWGKRGKRMITINVWTD